MEIVRDRYLNKLLERKENGLVKVVTGIRRCGKSYLLFHLYSFTLSKLCTHTGTLVFLRIWTCKFFDCANRSTLFKLPYFSMMSDDFPPLGLSKPLLVPLPGRRQPQGKGRGAL